MRARIALVLALSCASAAAAAARQFPGPNEYFPVRFVLDGDTMDVGGVGRVRLLGIDAPEFGSGFDTPAPFAREARDHLASLAAGRYVRLERDGAVRDGYARLLAYIIRGDGVVVNVEMVRAGLARVTARQSLRRLPELRRAEEGAQRARRGIWGGRPSLPGRVFRVPRDGAAR